MKKLAIICLMLVVFLLENSPVFSQTEDEDPHNFIMGMFSIGINTEPALQPGNPEFQAELRRVCRGNTGGFEGINIIQSYGFPLNSRSDWDNINLWRTFLADLNIISNELGQHYRVLVNTQITTLDRDDDDLGGGPDGIVEPAALTRLSADVATILNDVNADHIAGWYVADEPRNASPFSYTPNQVQEVIDAIRQGEQNAGHETLDTYLADEAIHHFNFAPPDNVSNCCYEPVTEYNYPCDVLLLSWYRYYDNNPNVPSEPFGEPPVRTLAVFNDIIPNARQLLQGSGQEIHMILNLGEQYIPL